MLTCPRVGAWLRADLTLIKLYVCVVCGVMCDVCGAVCAVFQVRAKAIHDED